MMHDFILAKLHDGIFWLFHMVVKFDIIEFLPGLFKSSHTFKWTLNFEWFKSNIWAAAWQNQQNGLCAQRRLRSAWASAQSDQSLRCPHEETLGP